MATTPGYPLPQSTIASHRQTWFYKNRKWFVPVLVLGAILVLGGFVTGIFFFVNSLFVNSYPYQFALERARASSTVAQQIGEPMKVGWFSTGSISYNGQNGDASLDIPISGPNGRGTIVVVAKKATSVWTSDTLEVDVAGQDQSISLQETAPLLRRIVVKHLGEFNEAAQRELTKRLDALEGRPRVESAYDQVQVDHMKEAIEQFWGQKGIRVGVDTNLTPVERAPRYSILEFEVYKK